MPHCAIYQDGTDEILYFVRDCIVDRGTYKGSNIRIGGIKFAKAKEKWTNDDAERLETGWSKKVSELAEVQAPDRIVEPDEETFREAIGIRARIASLTYAQLDQYIDNNVTDLASAKLYLKRLSGVVLAMAKMMDRRGK